MSKLRRGSSDAPVKVNVLLKTGFWAVQQLNRLLEFMNLWVTIIIQGFRPLNWRRTVRAAFIRRCFLTGVRALPLTLFTGGIVGMGLVFQALYWLRLFGESEQFGKFLVLVLVRELSPLLVGFIILGRSGAVMLVELGNLKLGGQVRALDAMGIDPFLIFLLPRVLATSVCCFCLNIAFLVSALLVGFLADITIGASTITIIEFVDEVLEAMGPSEFAITLCKPLFMGFGLALISCSSGLMISGSEKDITARLPGAFVRAVIVIFLISGFFSFLF